MPVSKAMTDEQQALDPRRQTYRQYPRQDGIDPEVKQSHETDSDDGTRRMVNWWLIYEE